MTSLTDEAVSFVIRHQIKANQRREYEHWLRKIMVKAAGYPGYLNVHVNRPIEGSHEYTIIVRFSSHQQATDWIGSDERRQLIAEVTPYLTTAEEIEIQTGIDFWFTPATPIQRHPVRWKQWLITTGVIWILTMFIPLMLTPLFERFPILGLWGIKQAITAPIIVGLVVYIIMPKLVQWCAKWLFR